MPLQLQLSLQGGGAKFVELLAVLEALQDLQAEKPGSITITRIAGTSAGALAGCLFSAGHQMSGLRSRFKDSIEIRALLKQFTMPGYAGLVYQLYWKEMQLWDTTRLGTFLEGLFKEKNKTYLHELNPPTAVISTDLRDRKKHSHDPKEDRIVHALLDSCGLPFLFRVWHKQGNDGRLLVDGGICENLPVDELVGRKAADGRIVAVSFRSPRRPAPQSLGSFAAALLDAAIENSVARARAHAGVDHVLEIDSELDTFDFEKAFTSGLGVGYENTKKAARQFFENLLSKEERGNKAVRENPWVQAQANESVKSLLQANWALYNTVFRNKAIDLLSVEMKLITQLKQSQPDSIAPTDRIIIEELFEPKEEAHCLWYSLEFSQTFRSSGATGWSVMDVTDSTNGEIKTMDFPTLRGKSRGILLFFQPPLRAGHRYKLTLQDEGTGLLDELLTTGKDEIDYTVENEQRNVQSLEIKLVYPAAGDVQLDSKAESHVAGEIIADGDLFDDRVGAGAHMKAVGLRFTQPARQTNGPATWFGANLSLKRRP